MSGKRRSSLLNREDNRVQLFMIGVFTLFPLSGRWNIIRLVLSMLLVFRNLAKGTGRIDRYLSRVFGPMLIGLIIPPLVVLLFEQRVESSDVIHEFERLLFYMMIIYLCWSYTINFKALYVIATLLFVVHFVVQILQYSGFQPVFNIIEKYYLQEGESGIHLSLARRKTLLNFRSGSIFMNPNVYMVIPCTYLSIAYQHLLKNKSIFGYLMIGVAGLSLLLTGSRTSVVVFFVITILYFNRNRSIGNIKWIILFPIFLAALWIMFFSSLSNTYRAFDIASGLDDSFGVKIRLLFQYLTHMNPIYFLTGSLGMPERVHLDLEIGYVYSYFGIAGLIWYVRFLKLFRKNQIGFPFFAQSAEYIVILIGLTATVILCLPVFPYVCILVLPQIRDSEYEDSLMMA